MKFSRHWVQGMGVVFRVRDTKLQRDVALKILPESVAKQGEMDALVTSTGANTYFGRTAKLVQTAGAASHSQKAVLKIGDYLIYLSVGLVIILVLVQLARSDRFLTLIQFALIIMVASIPVVLPAVLSVTIAVAGHLTLFVTRTSRPFWKRPRPAPILLWSAVVTKALATLFVVFPFGLITAIHWRSVWIIWAYCIAWLFMADLAKVAVIKHLDMSGRRHVRFLRLVKGLLQSGA